MTIRKMNLSDLYQVTQLYRDSNSFAKKKDIYNWTKRGLEKYPNLNYVYEKNNKILGAISSILKKGKKAIINDIVVKEEYRGKTIGSKLMNKIIRTVREGKIKKISLWVHWSNSAAIPFYYRFGFRIKNCIKTRNIKDVPDGEDVTCLEKFI